MNFNIVQFNYLLKFTLKALVILNTIFKFSTCVLNTEKTEYLPYYPNFCVEGIHKTIIMYAESLI